MFFWQKSGIKSNELINSRLFDQKTFYHRFIKDLSNCQKEAIIESPFITSSRMSQLMPVFKNLLDRKVNIIIITRDPIDHDEYIRDQATNEILYCNEIGVKIVLLSGNHHRKLAMLDRKILWEGSLNILSQNSSQEIMRRIEGQQIVTEMIKFLKLYKLF